MEIRKRAFDEVTIRRPELDEETRSSIAKSVGLAAIRYDIVKVTPEKSTVFDWNEALDFERQSGPYIQYAHARACSILEKAGTFTECYDLESEQEIALAKQIAKFPSVIEKIAAETPPSHTCHLFPRTCGYLQYLLSFRTGPEKRGEDPESPAYAGEGGAEHLERGPRNAGNRCHQHHVTPCAGRVTSFFQRRHQQRSSPVCGAKGHFTGGDMCYKHQFYGIASHRCVQMTPTLRCNQRCRFCWRSFEHEVVEEEECSPETILAGIPKFQKKALAGYNAVLDNTVTQERWQDALEPKHVAISLSGEPTLYGQLPQLIDLFNRNGYTTFLVSNGTNPYYACPLPPVPDVCLA